MNETFFYQSPLGWLKLSGNEVAIHELKFIDKTTDDILKSPGIDLINSQVIRNAVKELDNYFAGIKMDFTVPLVQHGTAFQQNVWQELVKIKCGQTASYLQLSKRMGNLKAIRAVGTANGKNKIAIMVPCHRVIGNDGSLVGYAGGLWRKKWLLEHEAKFSNGVQNLFDN